MMISFQIDRLFTSQGEIYVRCSKKRIANFAWQTFITRNHNVTQSSQFILVIAQCKKLQQIAIFMHSLARFRANYPADMRKMQALA
jgi:hypothetical protein